MHVRNVEDEYRVAATVKRGLEAEGYVVDVAVPGRETLDSTGGVPFDAIVVLDLPFPEADGLTVCRELGSCGARTRHGLGAPREAAGMAVR